MYKPGRDYTHEYQYVETDFIKHLAITTLIVSVIAVVCSALFREPVHPALKIAAVAQTNPVLFEKVAIGNLNGKGPVANYGPPYNNGTGNVQDFVQKAVGVIHPVNAEEDFILQPLAMAAHLHPSVMPALRRWERASRSQQIRWADAYAAALNHAHVRHGNVVVPTGSYGPVPTMMSTLLALGKSGLMSGALTRPVGYYGFDSQNALLFLQGRPLHQEAGRLEMLSNQWGIIHEENAPFPGPWWMTIVTAIYQIPYIDQASAGDAMALGGGLLLFVLLMLAPWIPGVNQLPRRLGVHKLIWRSYYAEHQAKPPVPPSS